MRRSHFAGGFLEHGTGDRQKKKRVVNVVRTWNDLVNLKRFHFDHVLTTSFDFPGRSEVFVVFLWCDATLRFIF